MLLGARPFVPFRLHMSDGGTVDIRSQEQVLLLRHFAVVALLDAEAADTINDRFMFVWYLHVSRVEMLGAGPSPFPPPAEPSESPSPAPA
jgi:hypothetical protein